MLWLNPNKIMSHYIVIISSFWLKCICDFLFSKVNPQSGILKNISLPLLWLPSSRSGSVSLDLEGDLPPTRKRWSPEPEKEASISFFLSLTQLGWMVILLPGLTGWGWILLFPGVRTPDQRPQGSFQETFSPARAFLDVRSHQAFLGGWKCQCQPHSVDLPSKHPLIHLHISSPTLINPGWRISKSL